VVLVRLHSRERAGTSNELVAEGALVLLSGLLDLVVGAALGVSWEVGRGKEQGRGVKEASG
jgi:hypothetical protein